MKTRYLITMLSVALVAAFACYSMIFAEGKPHTSLRGTVLQKNSSMNFPEQYVYRTITEIVQDAPSHYQVSFKTTQVVEGLIVTETEQEYLFDHALKELTKAHSLDIDPKELKGYSLIIPLGSEISMIELDVLIDLYYQDNTRGEKYYAPSRELVQLGLVNSLARGELPDHTKIDYRTIRSVFSDEWFRFYHKTLVEDVAEASNGVVTLLEHEPHPKDFNLKICSGIAYVLKGPGLKTQRFYVTMYGVVADNKPLDPVMIRRGLWECRHMH